MDERSERNDTVCLPVSRFEFERIDLATTSLLTNEQDASESEHTHDQCHCASVTLSVNLNV